MKKQLNELENERAKWQLTLSTTGTPLCEGWSKVLVANFDNLSGMYGMTENWLFALENHQLNRSNRCGTDADLELSSVSM